MLASCPACMVNHISPASGNPQRFKSDGFCSRVLDPDFPDAIVFFVLPRRINFKYQMVMMASEALEWITQRVNRMMAFFGSISIAA
jgi:hypothetical protein